MNDNYSCLSYRSQRGWVVKNLRRLFGPSFVCAHKGGPKKPPKLVIGKLTFAIIILSKLTIFVVGLDVVGFEVLGILVGLEDDDLTVHISTLSKQWQQLIAAGPILSLS